MSSGSEGGGGDADPAAISDHAFGYNYACLAPNGINGGEKLHRPGTAGRAGAGESTFAGGKVRHERDARLEATLYTYRNEKDFSKIPADPSGWLTDVKRCGGETRTLSAKPGSSFLLRKGREGLSDAMYRVGFKFNLSALKKDSPSATYPTAPASPSTKTGVVARTTRTRKIVFSRTATRNGTLTLVLILSASSARSPRSAPSTRARQCGNFEVDL